MNWSQILGPRWLGHGGKTHFVSTRQEQQQLQSNNATQRNFLLPIDNGVYQMPPSHPKLKVPMKRICITSSPLRPFLLIV